MPDIPPPPTPKVSEVINTFRPTRHFKAPPAAHYTTIDFDHSGEFLLLTHPRTAEFAQRRALDRPRWLRGMRDMHRRSRAPAFT